MIDVNALIAELDLINDPQVLFEMADAITNRINTMNSIYLATTKLSWSDDCGQIGNQPRTVLTVENIVICYNITPMDFYIKVVVR